jgi:hypothetical protein
MIKPYLLINNKQSTDPAPPKPPITSTRDRVLIVAGQSNARGTAGVADLGGTRTELTSGPLNSLVWNGASFVNVEAGVNTTWPTPNTNFGAELNAGYLIDRFYGDAFNTYIIKYAINATHIAKWMDGGSIHNNFTAWVNNALTNISANSDDYSVVMYWDQGESDGTNPFDAQYASEYDQRFDTFITDLRSDFNTRRLPVILRRHRADVNGFPFINEIIAAQDRIVQNQSDVNIIAGDDLLLYDGIHFDSEGQCVLGERLVQKSINLFD